MVCLAIVVRFGSGLALRCRAALASRWCPVPLGVLAAVTELPMESILFQVGVAANIRVRAVDFVPFFMFDSPDALRSFFVF